MIRQIPSAHTLVAAGASDAHVGARLLVHVKHEPACDARAAAEGARQLGVWAALLVLGECGVVVESENSALGCAPHERCRGEAGRCWLRGRIAAGGVECLVARHANRSRAAQLKLVGHVA